MSEAPGGVSSSTAVVSGDVVDLLREQHARIRDLFAEVEAADGEARRDSFRRLVRFLAVHETAEELVVRPLSRRYVDAGDAVAADRVEEERIAKEKLAELEELTTDHEDFLPKLAVVRTAVLQHARAEERYELSKLRRADATDELEAAARALRAAESLAPTHPHPGVESTTANVMTGPVLALVDRVRDVVRDAPGRHPS
ncbi:MAG TPA: hemerythrin domain-containing protein [Kineosporiaceae bacterium]